MGEEIRERNYKVSESGSSVSYQIGEFKKCIHLWVLMHSVTHRLHKVG